MGETTGSRLVQSARINYKQYTFTYDLGHSVTYFRTSCHCMLSLFPIHTQHLGRVLDLSPSGLVFHLKILLFRVQLACKKAWKKQQLNSILLSMSNTLHLSIPYLEVISPTILPIQWNFSESFNLKRSDSRTKYMHIFCALKFSRFLVSGLRTQFPSALNWINAKKVIYQ